MSTLRALLIPIDSAKPCQLVEIPERTAAACAAAIGCQWVELVGHPWLDERHMVLVVDEEGLLTGAMTNGRATRFYAGTTPIVGDALILGLRMTDDGQDFASLHPAQVGQLVHLGYLDSVPAAEEVRP